MEKIDPRHALEWLSINPQSWSALRLSIAQHLARERAEQMLRASERDSNMSKNPKRLSLQSALDAALADNAALVELLGRFARMHRDGSDPNELACRRGYSSDMTCLFSIDFENAHNAVENPHPGAALLAERDALKAEVADWRDTQRAVMSETCPTDEVHCTCVPMLKKKITELEAERDRLRKALEEAALALESCPPALMRQSYSASANAARAALAKGQSND